MDMRILLLISIIFTLIPESFAQDEREFRFFLESSKKKIEKLEPFSKNTLIKSLGPAYEIDLNEDLRSEKIVFGNRDGIDWMHIYSYEGKEIFRYKFESKGSHSRVYKLRLKKVSKNLVALVVLYFEGVNAYLGVRGTARAYVVTIKEKDLSKLKISKGPFTWEEFENSQKTHYHRRQYNLKFKDLDNDGTQEVVLENNLISYVMVYRNERGWVYNP